MACLLRKGKTSSGECGILLSVGSIVHMKDENNSDRHSKSIGHVIEFNYGQIKRRATKKNDACCEVKKQQDRAEAQESFVE